MTARVLHQFVPNFAAGDAIGVHSRLTQDALRAAGWESEIFYDEAQAAVRRLGRHFSTWDRHVDGRDGDAWILFQLSTGSRMTPFLLDQDVPFGVYFHNITPPLFFERWEPGASENLRTALGEMRRLAPSARFAIANSAFSEGGLVDAGFSPTAVSPVLLDPKELAGTPNPRLLQRLQKETADGGTRWLFIGRVAPNKCQHDVIAAFAAYREVYDPRARLTLVGGRTSNVYYRSLELLADELGVGGAVEFTDTISHEEKLACYRAADVFVCLSEHEGFKVPAVESMHFGLPVVAYATTAVPETVGEAGVLLPTKDPLVVAAAVDRVMTDAALRASIVEAGRRRAEDFSLARTSARLLDLLDGFVRT
ncbi:MAG TPA: glycosyltransferase family 4 protein [Acidimicrobiales bacterium]|nr:glycosyltransferase family 4 protein [Acidimicrobiales bacterium]